MPREYCISWDELHRNTRALAKQLLAEGREYHGIVGIARGGLIPATLLAREMGIRLIDTLCIASYEHTAQGEASVLKGMPGEDGNGWLLVDDLVDTGNTANIARALLPKAYFVAIYAKPQGKPLADAFVKEVDQDLWLHFPWDTDGTAYIKPLAE
ncbi:MAG TPA: xanthine phosphoribosyltransferase [Pseudomonadales bacterium]